jgi:diphthine-ammonia ligase
MASTSLNVIALISGGKDSLFSILHCRQNGHNIVALANLYPPPKDAPNGESGSATVEGEDVNSFMYQTVGHTIIPLYAEALNLPLYRHQISGQALNTERFYTFTNQIALDETEDLVPLLMKIKKAHPEANALSTGAILSTYQRTRVESVAVRLGLTPVAYLWQYPTLPPPIERHDSRTGLLDDMEAAGCDARLIKIASAGIKSSLLWSRVSDPLVKNQLIAGMSRFIDDDESSLRGAVLGEGGEYETLAVNGPPSIWRKRIEIDGRNNVVLQAEGGTTRLDFGKATLAEQSPVQDDIGLTFVRVPGLLDEKFRLLKERLLKTGSNVKGPLDIDHFNAWTCSKLPQNTSQALMNFAINNLTSPRLSENVAKQTTAIINQLDAMCETISASTNRSARVAASTILLRNMSQFAAVNAIYGERFKHINPPARVTICCGDSLPEGVLVAISFSLIIQLAPVEINGLHVQSISYWAPANIGPYSQAISVPAIPSKERGEEIVYLAGQIPLLPSSMQMLEGDFPSQAILSLQHLWRVGQCAGVDWWTHGVAYLADADIQQIERRARMAWEVWKGAHTPASNEVEIEEDVANEMDAWDLKHNHQIHQPPTPSNYPANSHLHILPDANVLTRSSPPQQPSHPSTPPFLAAHVSSLPRFAPIEWHSLGLAHLPKHPASKPCLSVSTTDTDDQISISTSTCHLLPSYPPPAAEETPQEPLQILGIQFFSIRIFAPPSPSPSSPIDLKTLLQTAHSRLHELRGQHQASQATTTTHPPHLTIYICSPAGYEAVVASGLASMATLIPCWSLWDEGGMRVEIAVVGLSRWEVGEWNRSGC